MKTTYEAFLAAAIHSQMPPAQADDLDAGEGGSWVTFGNLWAVRRADGSYWADLMGVEVEGSIETVARALHAFAAEMEAA